MRNLLFGYMRSKYNFILSNVGQHPAASPELIKKWKGEKKDFEKLSIPSIIIIPGRKIVNRAGKSLSSARNITRIIEKIGNDAFENFRSLKLNYGQISRKTSLPIQYFRNNNDFSPQFFFFLSSKMKKCNLPISVWCYSLRD